MDQPIGINTCDDVTLCLALAIIPMFFEFDNIMNVFPFKIS